jgi:hypothetical protein
MEIFLGHYSKNQKNFVTCIRNYIIKFKISIIKIFCIHSIENNEKQVAIRYRPVPE